MMYDSRGERIELRSDPGLVCWCGYDNNPLPGDAPPECCEGCGEYL